MSCLRWEEIAIGRFQAGTEVVELSIQYDDVVTRKFPTGGHGLVETITDFYLPRVEWSYYSLGLGEVRKHEVMHAARLRAAELAQEHGYVLIEDGAFTQKFKRATTCGGGDTLK